MTTVRLIQFAPWRKVLQLFALSYVPLEVQGPVNAMPEGAVAASLAIVDLMRAVMRIQTIAAAVKSVVSRVLP